LFLFFFLQKKKKMKFQILTVFVAVLAVTANAAEETSTTQKIKPTAIIPAPPGVVCAMSVCPTTSAVLSKRDLACPVICPDNCEVVNDVCCPGHQKAVCKSNVTASASQSGSTVAVPTSAPVSSLLPSASAKSSVAPAQASTSAPSAATLNHVSVLSTFLLGALLTVGLTQL
jgi:hypothetical protein